MKEQYNPYITRKKFGNKSAIYFEFDGFFTKEIAEYSLNRLAKLIFSHNKKSHLVWNCLKMQNYEEEARNICQEMIIDKRKNIGDIYLIADSTVMMAAAEIVSFFTQNNIKLVTSLEEFIEDFS